MKSENLIDALNNIEDKFIVSSSPNNFDGNHKTTKLYKKQSLLVAAIILSILLVACAAVAYIAFDIRFPFSDKDKTQYNATIYNVEPFQVSLELPEKWGLKERINTAEFNTGVALSGMWSILDIVNADQEVVGAIGYNTYEEYEGAEDVPQAIYNQIALGNDYHFDVRDSYTVMKENEYGNTAIVDVYYSASINDGKEKINKGIVSYNKDLLVYVAMEFDDLKTDEVQLELIANSLSFTTK